MRGLTRTAFDADEIDENSPLTLALSPNALAAMLSRYDVRKLANGLGERGQE